MARDTTFFDENVPWLMELTLKDFGGTVDDAAAAWGNAGHECGGFKLMQEINPLGGGRGGLGVFQFTGPRRVAFEKYCKRNGYDPRDLLANYKWFFLESKGAEKAWVPAVKAAVGLEAKTKAFELKFERAGVKHYDERYWWAKRAKEMYLAHPERRALPAKYGVQKMEPKITPIPATKSPAMIGSIVAALLGVAGVFLPWVKNIPVDTATTVIMQLISVGTFISGAIAAWGRYTTTRPIAGSASAEIVEQKFQEAMATPAPDQPRSGGLLNVPFIELVQVLPQVVEGLVQMGQAVRPLVSSSPLGVVQAPAPKVYPAEANNGE